MMEEHAPGTCLFTTVLTNKYGAGVARSLTYPYVINFQNAAVIETPEDRSKTIYSNLLFLSQFNANFRQKPPRRLEGNLQDYQS